MFDARSGELCRGGSRLRLRPQPSALLEHLVKHAGEVVTREDLRDILWPNGTFVCFDHGLNSCIKQLRAALGDQRVAPRYLETLPRRGYRFIAPINAGPAPGGENDLDLSCNLRIVADNCYATITLTTSNRSPHSWTTDSPVHLRDAFKQRLTHRAESSRKQRCSGFGAAGSTSRRPPQHASRGNDVEDNTAEGGASQRFGGPPDSATCPGCRRFPPKSPGVARSLHPWRSWAPLLPSISQASYARFANSW